MLEKFLCFMRYQRYNRKKKPWRSLKPAGDRRKAPGNRVRKYLYLIALAEAAVLFPEYGGPVAGQARSIISVSRESEGEKVLSEEESEAGRAGETREQGVSVDWKEGTVKLWQRVERVILKEPD
ncbi:hypothetical protein AALB39_22715 [Lachnospiraceae bacterium 54-53]